MDRHPDCEDTCMIHEHKGYTSCQYTSGRCEFIEDTRLEARDALRVILAARDMAPDVPIPPPLLAAIEAARRVL